jgi:multidrug efflux pump subunit AcrA (membrane-fusion protein)
MRERKAVWGFRVTGKIVKRLVDPGDKVKIGQPLMRIDATDYALALNAANADVEAASARKIQATADETRLKKSTDDRCCIEASLRAGEGDC